MSVDSLISHLSFSESKSIGEAMVTIAKHRAEISNALSEASAEDRPALEDNQSEQLQDALRALKASETPAPAPRLDKTA